MDGAIRLAFPLGDKGFMDVVSAVKKGFVRVVVQNPDGSIAQEYGEIEQLVVDSGKNFSANHLLNGGGAVTVKVAVGTDGTASSAGMTALTAQIYEDVSPTKTNPGLMQLYLQAVVGPFGVQTTLREYGVFFNTTLISRKSSGDDSNFEKTLEPQQRLLIYWTLYV